MDALNILICAGSWTRSAYAKMVLSDAIAYVMAQASLSSGCTGLPHYLRNVRRGICYGCYYRAERRAGFN